MSRLGRFAARQGDGRAQTPVRKGGQGDRAAVGLRDRAHDGEAEARTVAAGAAVDALEGLEQRRQGRRVEHVAVVDDLEPYPENALPGRGSRPER